MFIRNYRLCSFRREKNARLSEKFRKIYEWITDKYIKSVRGRKVEDRMTTCSLCKNIMCFSMDKHVSRNSSPFSKKPPLLLPFSLTPFSPPAPTRSWLGGLLQLTPTGFYGVSISVCSPRAGRAHSDHSDKNEGEESDGRASLLSVTCVGVKLRQGAQAQLRSWAPRSTWSPPRLLFRGAAGLPPFVHKFEPSK